MIRDTKVVEFETAHLLPGYNGGCGNLHGHSYKIEVTVEGPQNKNYYDMVMDFKDIKSAINAVVPDHRFVFSSDDKISCEIAEVLDKHNIEYVEYPFITTSENMVKHYAELINDYIHYNLGHTCVNVVHVKLWETSTSYSEWSK